MGAFAYKISVPICNLNREIRCRHCRITSNCSASGYNTERARDCILNVVITLVVDPHAIGTAINIDTVSIYIAPIAPDNSSIFIIEGATDGSGGIGWGCKTDREL